MARTLSYQRQIRDTVRQRARGRCELCDIQVYSDVAATDPQHASMHHRFPRRDGGRDSVSNLLYLCRRCHTGVVHKNESAALVNGWLCSERQVAACPVWLSRGWVRLANDGHYAALSWLEAADFNEVIEPTLAESIRV